MVLSIDMMQSDRVVLRALAFGPMRQAGICDSSGYSLNTIKASLRKLEREGLVERRETKIGKRYEYGLADNALAQHHRDTYLREYELLSRHKASRSPSTVLTAVDRMLAVLRTVRGE
jgi:DNA-binding IclR family transcriptional regulator